MNYWKIGEKEGKNGKSILHIVVDGKEVEKVESCSIKYLSSIANTLYKIKFNQYSQSRWKYAL